MHTAGNTVMGSCTRGSGWLAAVQAGQSLEEGPEECLDLGLCRSYGGLGLRL